MPLEKVNMLIVRMQMAIRFHLLALFSNRVFSKQRAGACGRDHQRCQVGKASAIFCLPQSQFVRY
jgi:hypothetical protein